MKKRLLGVIDATTLFEGLSELTPHRSVAAIPFGGRYRLIDFILSNMVNCGIQSVAIFPKYQYRSLMDHLGSGKNWELDRKRDGLFFFPSPELEKPMNGIGSFEHIAANIDFLNRSTQEYVLVSNVNTIFNIDFYPLLNWHIESGCEITEVRKDGVPLEIYLLKKDLLLELIHTRHDTGYLNIRDVAMDINSPYQLCAYHYEEYAKKIFTIQDYYSASMDLLNPKIWKQLFHKDRPILTKVKDEPPTIYLKTAIVHNSMVANGAIIEGTVENSIIARGVKIAKGAVIRNCIIMQKTQIGEGCVLEHTILDKDVRIDSGVTIIGTKEKPEILRKGSIVKGAWVNS
ncbi:sugar phosphate nucleotidyltransferase [Bacillus sp. B15-48]|uniref:sugar phosphate nucleotidyltransferase n=1 Tax=Bacillus sp. B15-48 TaxID=1548601 RepID=UPI0019400E1D|nr:sugar phosphate nucleotidyltransferase [Bacillus sp. B15-48]MBM4762669.1 glucose-1-phosphate adenylyltransferase [Bacillus sp. B15-48]